MNWKERFDEIWNVKKVKELSKDADYAIPDFVAIKDFIEQLISERDKEWKVKIRKLAYLYGAPRCCNLGHGKLTFHGSDVKCPIEKQIEDIITNTK